MVCFTKYDTLFPAALTSDELVFLQPVEYNSYFAGTCISWRRDANGGEWQPHYRITDHLGSTRLETSSNGTITAAYDYKPFGEQIPLMTTKTRKTYIGKERDEESYLGDFGVRKYDYAAGRFTSPDVLWEKYMGWSPYNYCGNNPISKTDKTGLLMIFDTYAVQGKNAVQATIDQFRAAGLEDYATTIENYRDRTDIKIKMELRTETTESFSIGQMGKGTGSESQFKGSFTMVWGLTTGLKASNDKGENIYLSPSLILWHELNEIDVIVKKDGSSAADERPSPGHEKLNTKTDEAIILGPERTAREACYPNQPSGARSAQSGNIFYQVTGTTSVTPR